MDHSGLAGPLAVMINDSSEGNCDSVLANSGQDYALQDE